ncbi:hypothetical protein B0H14DRAFT_3877844 [Mycena olivaceomarginata]|nr:hypothetical protein B0H14DRAFT_3877844 [Mycena olivaceomarginata]
MSATRMDMVKRLRALTSKHRPTVVEAGIRALGVLADPTRAERDVLLISRDLRPIASFPKSDKMRGQLKLASDQ